MRSFALRNPFWAFYIVAISFPSILFVYLTIAEGLSRMMGVSAVWILWLSRGKNAVAKLLSLYRPIQGSLTAREGARIYVTLIAFIALGVSVAIMFSAMFGEDGSAARFAGALGMLDWRLFLSGWIVALFLNQGALLEELGWRGYVWPIFVRYFESPIRAALVLGVAWAMWHSPRDVWMLATGQQTVGELSYFLFGFVPACIGLTIVAVYFVNITGGSVLPAIMLHGTFNYLVQGYSSGKTGIRSVLPLDYAVVWIASAIAILLLAGFDLGWRRRKELHGGDGSTDPSNAWIN